MIGGTTCGERNAEPVSPELAELADAYGVATQYWDQGGNLVVVEETVRAVWRRWA